MRFEYYKEYFYVTITLWGKSIVILERIVKDNVQQLQDQVRVIIRQANIIKKKLEAFLIQPLIS